MINKIICLGDSITKGKVWRENEKRPFITQNSYPLILKKILSMDVLNSGVCDITSRQMLERIGSDISFEKDSAVVIEIGGNDCNPNWKQVKKDPYGHHNAAVPIEEFKSNLFKIIEGVKKFGALPVLTTLPPLDGDRYYNLLKRVFGDGIKGWIDRNGSIFKWQESYSDVIKYIAKITGTFLIDTRKAFMDLDDYRKLMSCDGIHPNEDGYTLIADTCSKGLKLLF